MDQILPKLLWMSPAIAFWVVWAGTVTAQEVEVQGCGVAGEFCVLGETLESPETVGNESSDPTEKRLDPINQYGDNNSLGQVTNVSQLRDVQPSDWAYTALRSLIERYGILTGYPDRTFRGNRSMTRYEFAAGLRQALDQIQSLIARGGDVPSADLATLEQLTNEFVLELSLLRGDVDALTARTRELELTQFSTTTQLDGEVIIGAAGIVSEDDTVTTLGHRTRLNLDTSFTGQDLLRTRLQAEGLGRLERRTGTPEGELSFTGARDSDLEIDALLYRFPIGNQTQVVIAANAGAADDFTDTINPYLDGDGASGAVSRFATRAPIYYLVSGAGVGVRHAINDQLEVSLGYLAGNGGNPEPGNGLFDGAYGALAQVKFEIRDRATIGLTYVNAYNQDWQVGSQDTNLVNQLDLPVVTNSVNLAASVQLNPRFVVGGWAGYTKANVIDEGDANLWYWALTLALPDFGKTGNLGGFIIGMEPKVTGSDGLKNLGIDDPSTSLHLEAFYQYKLTDNITITPGIIWLTAPDHNSDNDDTFIGTIRTTLQF